MTTSSTSPGSGGSTVADTAGTARDSAGDVASSAADHAKDLAGTAQDRAGEVVDQATSTAHDLVGQTRDQVRTEAENRRGQAVSSLRAAGDELQSMQEHDGPHGWATDLVGRGTSYVRQTADWLEARQPDEILSEVQHFARRRPGTFLVGALLAGVLAGRLTRAVKAGPPPTGGSGRTTSGTSGPDGTARTSADPAGSPVDTGTPTYSAPPVTTPPPVSTPVNGTDPLFADHAPDLAVVDDEPALPAHGRPGGGL